MNAQIYEFFITFLLEWVFILLLDVATAVFLGLCVYYDGKSRQDDAAVMWGVLSGLFGIVALIYLIVRASSKRKHPVCPRCGYILPEGYNSCPYCGMFFPYLTTLTQEMRALFCRRRRLFLILFIVSMVLSILLTVLILIHFMGNMLQFVDEAVAYA